MIRLRVKLPALGVSAVVVATRQQLHRSETGWKPVFHDRLEAYLPGAHSTFMVTLALWLLNSGAYMHSSSAMPVG